MQTLSSSATFSRVGLTFWYAICVAAGNFWGFLLYHQCICYLHLARFLESASICWSLPCCVVGLRHSYRSGLLFTDTLLCVHCCLNSMSSFCKKIAAHFLAPSQGRVQERWIHESSNFWNFFLYWFSYSNVSLVKYRNLSRISFSLRTLKAFTSLSASIWCCLGEI